MRLKLKRIIYLLSFLLISLSVDAQLVKREFFTINASNELADNSAQDIVCTKTGRMIISTLGNLNFYDGTAFTHIETRAEYQLQLPNYQGKYRICFDRFHHLWLKSPHAVTCADLLYETFYENPLQIVKEMGCNKELQDVFIDSDGDVWFLTEQGLMDAATKRNFKPLRDRNIQELDVYDNLMIAFYDSGEEIALNKETGQVMHQTRAFNYEMSLKYNETAACLRCDDGFYLIRTGSQGSILLKFDVRHHQWTELLQVPYQMNRMALYENCLYVATSEGYLVYNLETGDNRHFTEFTLFDGRTLKSDVSVITFDKQGGMWLGTDKRGVLYARPKASPFNVYEWNSPEASQYVKLMEPLNQNISEFNGRRANCMYKDSRGWTWIGMTTGLYLYRTPKSEPEVFDRKHGILNNIIHSIVEDKHHNIWISTSCGISCLLYDGEQLVFINNFNQDDKVPNESFANCKAKCLDNGLIVMQQIDHVVTFHPDSFAAVNGRRLVTMYPKMIRMIVNGSIVEPKEPLDGNIIIDRAITRVRDINLNADQNTIVLTFSGLNYFRPIQTYYRVRLSGIDKDWRIFSYYNETGNVDNRGQLHYPLVGLEPGDYTLEVQASMFPDVWEEGQNPYKWNIHVNQPWWQTTGVYVIMLVIIFAVLVVNFILYSRNTRMRVRRNTEEGDFIRKVLYFTSRCDAFGAETLEPSDDDLLNSRHDAANYLSLEFKQLMLKLIPYIHKQNGNVTMRQLSVASDMDIVKLYDLLTSNINKDPRELARQFRLERAANLLTTTKKSIEEIADEYGFYTPNYFMGCFFHQYKMTPREYVNEMSES